MTVPGPRFSIGFTSLLALVISALMTGCGIGTVAPADVASYSQPASVSGTMFGGNTPVINAKVGLYVVGSGSSTAGTLYGAGSTLLATYTTDDNTAAFKFTKNSTTGGVIDSTKNVWQCPASGDPVIYLLGVGGNPNGGTDHSVNNPAIVQAAVIGTCNEISSATTVAMNEISTVAFTTALAQFIAPGTTPGTETVGYNSSTQAATGFANAYQILVNNLITVSTGYAVTSKTYTGTAAAVSAVQVTATPESAKLITMANILSSCINSSNTSTTASPACTTLLNAAVPPIASTTTQGTTMPTAQDTLQAALYMSLNPAGGALDTADCSAYANNVSCLAGLVTPQKAFPGDLSVAPPDWTIGISFTAGSTSAGTNTCASANFINGPFREAVDASGNLYWINDGTKNSLAEMSPIGKPLNCLKPTTVTNARGLAIDPSGNVWASFNSTAAASIYELPASAPTAFVVWPNTLNSSVPYNIFSDGSGNILFSSVETGGNLLKFTDPGTSTTTTAPTLLASGIFGSSTNYALFGAVDPSGNYWIDSYSSSAIAELASTGITSAVTSYTVTAYNSTTNKGTFTLYATDVPDVGETVTFMGFNTGDPASLADGSTCSVVTSSPNSSTPNFTCTLAATANVTATTETTATAADTAAYAVIDSQGATNSYGMAIDHSGYLYNGTTTGGTLGPLLQKWTPFVSGSTSAGAMLSSSTPYLGGINGVRAVAVDGAANVWVINAYSETGNAGATTNYGLSEIATSGSGTTVTFTALSPAITATPTACTTSAGCATGGGFYKSALQSGRDIAIDPTGNVWAPNTTISSSSSTGGLSLVQYVGSAVPVVTPLSVAAKNSMIGTKP